MPTCGNPCLFNPCQLVDLRFLEGRISHLKKVLGSLFKVSHRPTVLGSLSKSFFKHTVVMAMKHVATAAARIYTVWFQGFQTIPGNLSKSFLNHTTGTAVKHAELSQLIQEIFAPENINWKSLESFTFRRWFADMSLVCYLSRYAQRSICCITYVKPKTEPANAYYGPY